jgi:two-component system, cell cycle sensor histidine kinase and response regulator CckA
MEKPVILVADDEAQVRDLIRYILESAGYAVLTAADGEQALQVSRTFPTTIHLLLSDVLMPKLDGIALREQILQERPATKVLLLSGTAERPPGEVEFLRKPFQAEILTQHVRRLLSAGWPAWPRLP